MPQPPPQVVTHRRTIIRQAVKGLLTSADTAAGARVYDTRLHPANTQPAIFVSTPSDTFTDITDLTVVDDNLHDLAVEVIVTAQGNTDLAETLDDLCEEGEAAIYADPYLAAQSVGFRIQRVRLEATALSYTLETDPEAGQAVQSWVWTYREA